MNPVLVHYASGSATAAWLRECRRLELAEDFAPLGEGPLEPESIAQPSSGRRVLGGPWDGHRIRTARKPRRCDYNYGAANGGRCQHVIQPGESYVEGEIDPYRAGGYAMERYCLVCAGVQS